MDAKTESTTAKNRTTVERTSDRELVVTRTIDGPAHLVFEAWTMPELIKRWWVPKSFGVTLLSCETDVRTGGGYRLVFAHGDGTMDFFGKYVEVDPPRRLVWTNDESGENGSVTTLTLEEVGGKTRMILHELYPTKEALDAAMESGEKSGMDETFSQLEELLGSLL